jgi:hypothetical protein
MGVEECAGKPNRHDGRPMVIGDDDVSLDEWGEALDSGLPRNRDRNTAS